MTAVEILEAGRPPFRERPQALPPRAGATLTASTCLVALALLTGCLLAPHPASRAPTGVGGTPASNPYVHRAAACRHWLSHPHEGTPLLHLTLHTWHGDRYVTMAPAPARYDGLDRVLQPVCAG